MKNTYPPVDDSFARLYAAGWSIGDVGTSTGWLVTGINGENMIRAEGRTHAEAWYRACQQAESLGMLRERKEAQWLGHPR